MGSRKAHATLVSALIVALGILSACSNATPTPDPDSLAGGIVATFDVNGERFNVWLTNDETIENVYELQRGESNANIPNGPIQHGAGRADHNAPHDWHLDPEATEMAEVTFELCDGAPSYVDDNTEEFVENVGRYCPWSAELVEIDDHR